MIDDILDAFNWIDRLSNLGCQLLSLRPHRNLRGQWRLTPGLAAIHIARQNQAGGDAERLLKHYGIPIHGRRVRAQEVIFSVPAQQGNWAEYLLLRAGITLAPTHRLIDPRNVRWAGSHDNPVPAWVDRSSGS